MGRMQVVLDDKIQERFRKKVCKNGYKLGDYSAYIQRLIEEDLNTNLKKNRSLRDDGPRKKRKADQKLV